MGLAAMMANIMSQDKIFAGDKQRRFIVIKANDVV